MENINAKSPKRKFDQSGVAKLKRIGKSLYVGENNFMITKKNDMDILVNYANFIMGEGYGIWMNYEQSKEEKYIPIMLLQMVFAIINYNNVYFNNEVEYMEITDAYPDYMVYDIKDNIFYIDTANILEFLKKEVNNIPLQFSNDDCLIQDSRNSADPLRFDPKKLMKLFIIADHCATHYLELVEFDNTDLFCHNEFGKGYYYTLANRLEISTIKNSLFGADLSKNYLMIESSYLPYRSNNIFGLQNVNFGIEFDNNLLNNVIHL